MDENKIQELIQAVTGLTRKEINSIELNRTKSGEYSWSIKIYCEPGKESDTINQIKSIDDKLKLTYKIGI